MPVSANVTRPLRDGRTLSTRLGGWPERVLAAAGLLAAGTGVVLQRRRRRAEGTS